MSVDNTNQNETAMSDAQRDALTEKSKRIGEMLFKAETRDTKLRYSIGAQVLEAMGNTDMYGESPVERIAERAGCTSATLYACASVASAWHSAEFDELAVRKNSKNEGLPLTFTHFTILAKVKDPVIRSDLFTLALEEGDSVSKLQERIHAQKLLARGNVVRALRPKDAVKKLVSSSKAWVERAESDIKTLGAVQQVTPQLVEQVKVVRDSYGKAKELIEQLDAGCAALLARATTSKAAE
jgi:hypothetical protein